MAAITAARPQRGPIEDDRSFADLGLDSLDRLVLVHAVEQATGIAIPDHILANTHNIDDLLGGFGAVIPCADADLGTASVAVETELGVVDDGAVVGAGSRLWHAAQVAAGACIGADCTLGKGVYVGTGSQIGNRVKIGNYACVFGANIADDAMINPHAALLEDPAPRATTPDGRRKQHTDFDQRPVTVSRRATVGAGAMIAPGITVGHDALVAIGAVVVRDVLPHALVAGNPARQCGWVCICGHTLTDALRCPRCSGEYVLQSGELHLLGDTAAACDG
ncbi:phosphopantetheine-binding protein [Salinispora cortesiana]|uniref:phosphopantetheine-binding protein n=1 Tax=Salinispora cortesiana TaxID=1305843 RepID=UPI0003FD6AA1|nr:phosphopantetheine-binding protein [Salinispora cortesiana]